MRRLRSPFAAVAAVALVAGFGVPSAGAQSAGPAATSSGPGGAAWSQHVAAMARGFSSPASGVRASGTVHAANTAAVTQPGKPTDINGTPVAEPRAAVTGTSASYSPSTLRLTLTPKQYTDPTVDPGWQNPNTFFLFVFGRPGARTLTGITSFPANGATHVAALTVTVDNQGGLHFGPLACPGLGANLGQATHPVYSVSMPSSCFGAIRTLSWFAALAYDAVPGDQNGTFQDSDIAPEAPPLPTVNPYDDTQGYWLFAGDGGVFTEGNARFFGSLGNVHLVQPIVAAAGVQGGKGYWLAAGDGGVFAFGGAGFHGSLGNLRLAQPIVAMAARPQGDGYWLFARDGGVFSFGKAAFHGSLGNVRLAQPIVGGFASADGGGYILIAADGGVFAFGDAHFRGSLGNTRLNQPVVTGAATPNGKGYWLFARDGGVFTFGGAPFLGSTGNIRLVAPIVSASAAHGGYRMAAADGGVFTFGVPFEGSEGGTPLVQPIVTMATAD